jgi:methionyl-tRNA synthetase
LVTPALPYANGPIHIGHLVEHIQVNIFVRALRMAGEDVLYVCGADSHGTPIELKALDAGMAPEAYAGHWQKKHEKTFTSFGVDFDGGYGTTHTDENKAHAQRIFLALKEKGHVSEREVEQLFDEKAGRFLADRMIKGTCPRCRTPDQYGDSCEAPGCGAKYEPTDLKDAKSVISGATPVMRKSTHVFVKLGDFTDRLKEWTENDGAVNDYVKSYLKQWFDEGLKDWDISRDAPYHGFEIPGYDNKYFYVWLDAPIGYVSISERAAKERGRTFEDYWRDPETKIFHFIGKDIVYFHTLFWPAMLMAAGDNVPTAVPVHGMLTVDGTKMSKSRGTFIMADDWADKLGDLGVEALRYYYACKLTHRAEDIDLNLEDFVFRVNADLVNKVINLVSRTIPMLHRNHEGKVGELDPGASAMLDEVKNIAAGVEGHYRALDFARVVKDVVDMADLGNKYLQDEQPWKTVKEDADKAHRQLSTALAVGKACVGLLKPIIPEVVAKVEAILGVDYSFANATEPLAAGTAINKYAHVFQRLDQKKVQAVVVPAETKKPKNVAKRPGKKEPVYGPDADGHITIDGFFAVDMRAAKVVEASDVEGADKLIALKLDVGALGERSVFTGLKPHVQPGDLQGRTMVLVANLKPRKMKFGMSEGMVLSTVGADGQPRPMFVDDAKPGDKVE